MLNSLRSSNKFLHTSYFLSCLEWLPPSLSLEFPSWLQLLFNRLLFSLLQISSVFRSSIRVFFISSETLILSPMKKSSLLLFSEAQIDSCFKNKRGSQNAQNRVRVAKTKGVLGMGRICSIQSGFHYHSKTLKFYSLLFEWHRNIEYARKSTYARIRETPTLFLNSSENVGAMFFMNPAWSPHKLPLLAFKATIWLSLVYHLVCFLVFEK